MNSFFKLIIAIAVSEAAGIIGSFFTVSAIPTHSTSSGLAWYAGLVKPALNPPSWVFGPVWTTLYALMGVALFLIWNNYSLIRANKRIVRVWRIGIAAFFIQLFLNAIWSIIFFGSTSLTIIGLNNIGIALIDIILLWLAIVWTMVVFYKISKPAAYLLVPYILWVSFAGYLNYSIWILNRAEPVFCTQEAKLCSDGSYVGRTGSNCQFAACPKENLIFIENPRAYEEISSPLLIKGKARGFWFFEASFPIRLVDENGKTLETGIATAKTDPDAADGAGWMTTDFVDFEEELNFPIPTTEKGYLIFEKDNPSGLPENADELKMPIAFSQYEVKTREVFLYYYNLEQDKDQNDNVMCSEKGLVALRRAIPLTQTPIQDTIKLLLKGEITANERDSSVDTEYPLEGFALKSTSLKNGVLTLEFSDPYHKTVGGSCRVGILRSQVEVTAKQFPEVKQVRFLPEELFQP